MNRRNLCLLAVVLLVGCSHMEGMMKSSTKSKKPAAVAQEKALEIGGVAPYQVFASKNGKGSIAFQAKGNGTLQAWLVRDADGSEVTRADWSLSSETLTRNLTLKDVPVGGEYTAHFRLNDLQTSVPHLLVGELWVVSGQSNALGAPGKPYQPIPQVHILHGDEWFEGRDPLFPWFGDICISPWVQAARDYYKRTGVPVGLMGYCAPAQQISYFMDLFQNDLPQLSPIVEKHGKDASVYLWYQGESDCETDRRLLYDKRLKSMTKAMRRYTGNPDMTVVIVQLSYLIAYQPPTALWGRMRDVQSQFCAEDGNAILVPALAYPHKDPIHLNADGARQLGGRIAQALAEKKEAGKPVWQGPRAVSAKFTDAKRKQIRVEFDSAKELRLTKATGVIKPVGKEKWGDSVKDRDPKTEWFVTDSKRRGEPEILSAKIEKGVLKVELAGGQMLTPKVSGTTTESLTVKLAAQDYLQPARVSVDGLSVVLDFDKPVADNAKVSYALLSDSRATLSDEQGRPAAAFVDLVVKK